MPEMDDQRTIGALKMMGISTMVAFLCWIEAHPGTASWAQAAGSFVAILIAIAVPAFQHRTDRRKATAIRIDDRERRKQDAHDATRRMACVLEAELRGLVTRERKVHVAATYRRLAGEFASYKIPEVIPTFDAHQNYTAIYDSVGDKIAHLDPELALAIVALYTDIKGILDTLNNHARFDLHGVLKASASAGLLLKKIAGDIATVADRIDAVMAEASRVADLLAEVARRD